MDRFVPIGERIAVYRRRRGLSQTKPAHLVGRSENWLSQIERGERPIRRLGLLAELAKVLEVPMTELIGTEPRRFATGRSSMPPSRMFSDMEVRPTAPPRRVT